MTKTADILVELATGEMGTGEYTGRRLSPTHDEIAQLAFCLYEKRGREDGYHLEDWLRAEALLVHHYA
jgi:DUF2934 family protein